MPQKTGEFPRPISRPTWLTSRARNAVNRPLFIGAVGVGTFIIVLVGLFLAPQQVRRGAVPRVPVTNEAKPDTVPLLAALNQAQVRAVAAESALASARVHPITAPPPTLVPDLALVARRDTLSTAINDLDALLTRVESAPVGASYRALGESSQLASNARAKALLDSLDDIERDRDAFGAAGAGDPVYIALSARATEIGRAIQALGQERRDALRDQLTKVITPVSQTIARGPVADTAAWIATRDSARSMVGQASAALVAARAKTKSHDLNAQRASADARVDVPPIAILCAALVFGIALGFGSAFLREIRHPRISGDHEVERTTGARVLATVRPRSRHPERRRRFADHDSSPYFDPAADGYQLTYLHVARAGASRLVLTITGEETGIAAVIASNIAAIAADEARTTILIDTDAIASPVAAVLRQPAAPGLIDVVDHRRDWSEVTTQAAVGRDRVIDVIPSGMATTTRDVKSVVGLFAREAARMARHYEAIVIVASIEQTKAGVPGVLPIPDTVICARVGQTRIADLEAALVAVRAAGGNPLGVVLWDAPPPDLPKPSGWKQPRAAPPPSELEPLTPAR